MTYLVYSSASIRALTTMNIIANTYDKELPKELFVDLHEFGGVYIGEKAKPGMNATDIKKVVDGIFIENEDDLTQGWWKSDNKETEDEFKDRVKRAITKLKEMAKNSEEDFCVCIVSHGVFLNAFFSTLLNCEIFVDS